MGITGLGISTVLYREDGDKYCIVRTEDIYCIVRTED